MSNDNIIKFRIADHELHKFLHDLPNTSEWVRDAVTLIYELQMEYQIDLPGNIAFRNFVVQAVRKYFNGMKGEHHGF